MLHRFQQMQHLVVFKHQAMPRTAPRFIKYNLMRSLHEQEQWLELQTIETYRDYAAFWCRKWMEMVHLRGKISGFCAIESPVSNDKGILWQATWQSMWSLCGQFMSVPHVAYPPISAGWTEDERNESVQICASGLRMSLRYWSLRMRCMRWMRSLSGFRGK